MVTAHNDRDPLAELLVDARHVDRQAITEALRGRVSIDSESGRAVLLAGYSRLDAKRKILTVLLGRKAAQLLNVVDHETLTNGEVVDATGLPPGTVASSLKNLRERRLVGQEEDRSYLVPNPQLGNVITFINSQPQGREQE
jgi:hypothetical protein